MMRRLVLSFMVSILAVTTAFAQTGRPRAVAVGASEAFDINGEWTMRIVPLIDASGDAEPIELTATILDVSGAVIGRAGMLALQGMRTGNELDLEVHQIGEDERDHLATLKVTIESSHVMTATAVHPVMSSEYTFAVDKVTFTRAYSSNATGRSLEEAAASLSLPASSQSFASDLCSTVVGQITSAVTDKLFVPMGACSPVKNGGGYYSMGDVGPGARFFGTVTEYIPVEWSACGTRKYKFTISSDGAPLWSRILDWANSDSNAQAILGQMSGGAKLAELQALRDQVGDFAIVLGYSARTHNASIYIITPQGHCDKIQNSSLYKGARAALSSFTKLGLGDVSVMCGNPVRDTWTLRRSPYVSASVCNTPVFFMYLFGTISVRLD